MAFILNIDTSQNIAHVSIAKDGIILIEKYHEEQKNHAKFLHVSIQEIVNLINITIEQLDAIAVIDGPGSYTGLRVGMATAKGLCYALQKPLITISSLKMMANAIKTQHTFSETALLCPMIDARRMEVYTALYNNVLNEILAPCAFILEPNSFERYSFNYEIYFFGSGSIKWKSLIHEANNCIFLSMVNQNSQALAQLSYNQYLNLLFADVVYAEPAYLKDFFNVN